MPKISFKNVKKVYPNGTYALKGVTFDIDKGDFVCIIGESGGGKTTLLRLIAGLEKATCGEIFFNDEISNYLEVAKRDVAFVFQDYALYPNKTVFENIISSLSKSKMSYEEKYTKTIDIIEQMDLEIISGEVPKHLSFGQCQKVALARALVRKPKIMLFDEPLSNIDPKAKEEYKSLILEAKRLLPHSTFVYVTHNINDALQLSNKIMVIDQGNILQYDYKNIVYDYPINKVVSDYILEYKGIDTGIIENDVFKGKKDIPLSIVESLVTQNNRYENVTVYASNKNYYFFDKEGNSISVVKDEYLLDIDFDENGFEILNQKIKFKEIRQVLLKRGKHKAVLYRNLFSFNKTKKTFEISGEVVFTNKKIFTIKVDNTLISLIHDNNYSVKDIVKLYYPYEKLKAIDEKGNKIIANYVISTNELEFKIIDSKKGIIRIGKQKIQNDAFINIDYLTKIRVPINAFKFHDNGKFECDYLFNEELLGNRTLIHFRTKGVGSYLSSLVSSSFNGYSKIKIKYDIDFTNVKIKKVGG